ncbi:MAG: leucine-rich repeat domain-containing protein [Treponema sp.]|jgi:hypothetical protein|nr:leucine-rich repeat domain-containing protein [Treponema sp.]
MRNVIFTLLFCGAAAVSFGQSSQVTDFTGGNVNLVTRGDFVLRGTQLAAYTGRATELVIPGNLGITEIGESCFSHAGLVSVTIPQGVRRIGRGAFESCYALASVTLPAGLIVIDDRAFYRCSNLLRANIPAGILVIGAYAFYECNKLTVVNLPADITYIAGEAIPNGLSAAYDRAGRRAGTYNFVRGFNAWRYGTEPVHQALRITPGTPVTASFQNSSEQWYYLTIPEGGAIITVYTEGSIDTVLAIYDINGNEVDDDDDSGTDTNARINLVTAEGVLYLKVWNYYYSKGSCVVHAVIEAL